MPGGGGNSPDRGNRIDNRARGNAAQLLEKYKALARDAQMQGDRVNTEYYLQFADHYFRVLSESRARFEEQQQQRPRRDEFSGANDFQNHGDGEEFYEEVELNANGAAHGGNGEDRERGGRRERFERPERPERSYQRDDREQRPRFEGADRGNQADSEDRRPRGRRAREDGDRDLIAEAAVEIVQPIDPRAEEESPRPRRGRKPRQPVANAVEAGERIEIDRLPPAFGADAPLLAAVEGEPVAEDKPRRRTRRPRSDAVSADA
jgi:hypothetical protein